MANNNEIGVLNKFLANDEIDMSTDMNRDRILLLKQ